MKPFLPIFGVLLALGTTACLESRASDDDDPADEAEPAAPEATAKTAPAAKYTVGGTVAGLVGPVVIARINGGDTLVVQDNGAFKFPTLLATGATYNVTVLIQPSAGRCTVENGAGVIGTANVTNVKIVCSILHKVGGMVTGLAGSGLVLRNNGGDSVSITANGAFSFPTMLAAGASYAVTTASNPTAPTQRCEITNGNGVVGSTDVTNVAVACTTSAFTVGGTLSGASGPVVLQNNGRDDLATAGGAFTFATPVASGQPYSVTIVSTTNRDRCTVVGGSGSVDSANIAVAVTCVRETEFYVDATNGNDANAGSATSPWRTITKAIATAPTTGANIHVAPGTYSAGETFPIAPRANQHLIGDVANLGEGPIPTRISGSGAFNCSGGDLASSNIAVAVGLEAGAANASIAGFSITGGSETVWICNTTATLANNTVFGSTDISVLVGYNANVTLTGNRISSGAYGLLVHDAGTRVVARNNTFGTASRAVVLGFTSPFTGANVDLGTATSPGNNVLANAGVGVYFQNTTSSVVTAVGNTWKASTQGADAEGRYAAQRVTANVAGTNFTTSFTTGGGLQL